MKINRTLTMSSLLMAICFLACEGPKGDLGPQGPQGVAGKDGAAGAPGSLGATGSKGDQGTAKVVYTAWKGFPTDKIGRGTGGSFLQFSGTNTSETAFTKEAIDQGVIMTYIKYNSLGYNANTQSSELVESITTSTSLNSYFKIPGRTQNRSEDFGVSNAFITGGRRENFFDPVINVWSRTFASTTAPAVPELQNLTDDQYRALIKDIPQYRHVVIYGSTKGRIANLNLNDYAAVKAAFNIPD
ncbi:collagen-like protein [Runella aurantiaca]|nr:collagen-like protein [Runella aurantiaca]